MRHIVGRDFGPPPIIPMLRHVTRKHMVLHIGPDRTRVAQEAEGGAVVGRAPVAHRKDVREDAVGVMLRCAPQTSRCRGVMRIVAPGVSQSIGQQTQLSCGEIERARDRLRGCKDRCLACALNRLRRQAAHTDERGVRLRGALKQLGLALIEREAHRRLLLSSDPIEDRVAKQHDEQHGAKTKHQPKESPRRGVAREHDCDSDDPGHGRKRCCSAPGWDRDRAAQDIHAAASDPYSRCPKTNLLSRDTP